MRAQEFSPRTNPAPVYYFAYGMLTDPKNMPGCQAIGAARLHNHRLEFYQYADVEPSAGSEVRGVLWSLPDGMLRQLDQIEGVPYLYNRKMLPVMVNGQRYEAYVYTMTPQARQQVQHRTPDMSYLRTLARGYIKFGLPNGQLHDAIQRAKNPESDLTEVAMNPRAFASSARNAASRGVMVGYEFEVLVPKTSVQNWQQSRENPAVQPDLGLLLGDQTLAAVLKRIVTAHPMEEVSFSHFFKTSHSNDVVDEYTQSVKSNPVTLKKYIAKIKTELQNPEFNSNSARKTHTKFIRKFKKATGYDLTDNSVSPSLATSEERHHFFDQAKEVCRYFYYDTSNPLDRIFSELRNWPEFYLRKQCNLSKATGINAFSKWAKNTYGTDILRDLLLTDRTWKFTSTDRKRLFISLLDPSYVIPSRNSDLYNQAAQMINATMSPAFGTMTVFDRYHESRKQLDRWYIEPDGSLRPQSGDTSCEIVGPPTPAAKAMSDLRSFYKLASSLQLYTNSSTGLHVNVSIPDSLDVLKLAVLLGDQYVLQSFGRANSRFAVSVLQSLKDRTFVPQNLADFQKKMTNLVNSISGDHFASINWNGKYVSFRQAGGDYLANQTQIENTVGRFVRAMVIASDPAAYRNEYMKKLASMAPDAPGRATQADARISARTNGIWVVEREAVITGRVGAKAHHNMVRNAERRFTGCTTVVIPNSDRAKSALLTASGLKTQTREKLATLPVANFFHVIIVKKDMKPAPEVSTPAFAIYNDNLDKIGVATDKPRLIKPSDPDFTAVMNALFGSAQRTAVSEQQYVHSTPAERDRALIQAHRGTWKQLTTEGLASESVKFLTCPLFDRTYAEKSNIPGIKEKFNSFVEQKTIKPVAPFGSRDSIFINSTPLGIAIPKLRHAHLTNDLSIFYTIEGRDPTVVRLYGIFSHDDSGTGQPRNIAKQKSLGKQMRQSGFNNQFAA